MWRAGVIFALLFGLAASFGAGGKRTLVILQDLSIQRTHSQFFADLDERGHELDFHAADESGVALQKYGEWFYDNVILFAPQARRFAGLQVSDLVDFIDAGGNILQAVDNKLSKANRQLASECGVDYDAKGSLVMDHFLYDAADPHNDHSLIHGTHFARAEPITGALHKSNPARVNPVLYRGIGHAVNSDNILAVRALTGAPTTYSAFADQAIEDYPQSAGLETLLVTGIQARNNARLLFSGSLDMFSDALFDITPMRGSSSRELEFNLNRKFCESISQWVFAERGMLRFSNVRHVRADGTQPEVQLHEREQPDLPESLFPDPEIARSTLVYRVKDEVLYSIDIEEYRDGQWQPFQADDVQLEFVMLNPYVRTNLSPDEHGTFSAQFTVPDVYGIYQFRVLYRRPGYSVLHSTTQVSVRPFRHNEFERFISSAYPYYASAFTMMAGFFVFSGLFLYTKD